MQLFAGLFANPAPRVQAGPATIDWGIHLVAHLAVTSQKWYGPQKEMFQGSKLPIEDNFEGTPSYACGISPT